MRDVSPRSWSERRSQAGSVRRAAADAARGSIAAIVDGSTSAVSSGYAPDARNASASAAPRRSEAIEPSRTVDERVQRRRRGVCRAVDPCHPLDDELQPAVASARLARQRPRVVEPPDDHDRRRRRRWRDRDVRRLRRHAHADGELRVEMESGSIRSVVRRAVPGILAEHCDPLAERAEDAEPPVHAGVGYRVEPEVARDRDETPGDAPVARLEGVLDAVHVEAGDRRREDRDAGLRGRGGRGRGRGNVRRGDGDHGGGRWGRHRRGPEHTRRDDPAKQQDGDDDPDDPQDAARLAAGSERRRLDDHGSSNSTRRVLRRMRILGSGRHGDGVAGSLACEAVRPVRSVAHAARRARPPVLGLRRTPLGLRGHHPHRDHAERAQHERHHDQPDDVRDERLLVEVNARS